MDEYAFKMFLVFVFTNSKLYIVLNLFHLNLVQGSRVVHFTMLAPNCGENFAQIHKHTISILLSPYQDACNGHKVLAV